MTRSASMSGRFHKCARSLGVETLAVASIAFGLIGFGGGEPAVAAISTVGGTCGFHLGAPLVTGSAGSAGLEFPVYPANPSQVCQVRVTARASLSPASGGSYTNVIRDPVERDVHFGLHGWAPPARNPLAMEPSLRRPGHAGDLHLDRGRPVVVERPAVGAIVLP